jgi:hypothetical protein
MSLEMLAAGAGPAAVPGHAVQGGIIVAVAVAAHGKDPCTGTQLDWLVGLAFVLPAALAVAYKARRGDRRGVTGTRPVFRRRPR